MTKIAIIFFGLTRSLMEIYPQLKENVFDILALNNIEYDIFIHTYQINKEYVNRWSGKE